MAEGMSLGGLYVTLGGDDAALMRMIENVESSMKKVMENMKSWGQKTVEEVQLKFYAFGYAMEDAAKKMETLSSKFTAAGQPIKDAGLQMTLAGAAISGGLTMSARQYGAFSDELGNMAIRTGIAASSLSQLQYAAELSGTNLQAFEMSLRKMQRTISQAADGSEHGEKALRSMGLTLQQLKGLAPDKQFELVADAISKIDDPAKRAGISMQLFGQGSTRMLTLMEKGGEGIRKLRQEAIDLGYALTNEDVKAGKEFNDSLQAMYLGLQRIYYAIGNQVAPVIREYADWVRNHVVILKQWIDENGNLFRTLLYIGGALTILGTILTTVGTAFIWAGTAVNAMSVAMKALNTTFLASLGWSAVIMLVVAAVLILTDALLQLFGVANLGITDMIGAFRIGGVQISTWMTALWLNIFKGWEWVKYGIINGWESIKISVSTVGRWIYDKMLAVLQGISNAFWATVKQAAAAADFIANLNPLRETDSNMAGTVQKMKDSSDAAYTGLRKENEQTMNANWENYSKTLDSQKKQTQKQVDEYNKSISDIFHEDYMKSQERPAKAAAAATGAGPTGGEPEFETTKTSFQQINLNRFALPSETGAAGAQAFQQVRAPGIEDKLDQLITITKSKQVTATLG